MPLITLFLCWGKPIFQRNLCQQWIDERPMLEQLWTSFANPYCISWENWSAVFHTDVLRTEVQQTVRYSDTAARGCETANECQSVAEALQQILPSTAFVCSSAVTKVLRYFSWSLANTCEFQHFISNCHHRRKKGFFSISDDISSKREERPVALTAQCQTFPYQKVLQH